MSKLTDVPGILVGHATHPSEQTGCTVVLCQDGAVAGVDIRGSAPGTRETELLRPTYMIRKIHAVMLTGGSAFGLRSADGAMQYLAERGIGYDAQGVIVPIVPAAVIFDLFDGRSSAFPSTEMGYQACENAAQAFEEGLVGAGRGGKVGKILGIRQAMAGGIGTAAMQIPGGARIGALVVVNTLGDVIDPASGEIVAGARHPKKNGFLDTLQYMTETNFRIPSVTSHTTLAVIATDGKFTKEEISKIAQMAQNGVTRTTRPAHTLLDGDVVFALSTGNVPADVNLVGELAAQLVAESILRAVRISNNLM